MLLVADVGNSHTVLGLFDDARLVDRWRITTGARTGDELGLVLRDLLRTHADPAPAVDALVVCTVVPSALRPLREAAERYLRAPLRVLESTADLGFPVRVERREEVGVDRLVNVIAARERLAPPFLVVDLGTATTFDCVAADGAFVGGAIAPGPGMLVDALGTRTARLPRVELGPPENPVGTHTRMAMQSGLFWGYVGLVEGLVARCRAELGPNVRCVATGGLAGTFAPHCRGIDEVDADLTLHGLRTWYERGAR